MVLYYLKGYEWGHGLEQTTNHLGCLVRVQVCLGLPSSAKIMERTETELVQFTIF
jgi:hypothetical protein